MVFAEDMTPIQFARTEETVAKPVEQNVMKQAIKAPSTFCLTKNLVRSTKPELSKPTKLPGIPVVAKLPTLVRKQSHENE